MLNANTTLRSRPGAVKAAACVAALCTAFLAPSLLAQVSSYGDKETGPANDKPPSILNGVGISQNLNAQLPLSLIFTDDQGKQVQLASYFGRKPAILALVYYQCPMLCSEELNGLTGALQMVDDDSGKDFNVIVVSIDPTEATDLAAAKKRSYLKKYGHPETANGWHFMTGTQANIDTLTKAVGFGYVKIPGPDGKLTQFAHASAIQIVTPEGKLAQYYMGVEYSPKDLRTWLGGSFFQSHRLAGRQYSDLLLPLRSPDQQALPDCCQGGAVGRVCNALLAGRLHAGHVPPRQPPWTRNRRDRQNGDRNKGERITE